MAAQPRSSKKKSTKLGRKESPAKATSPGPRPQRNSNSQHKPIARKVAKAAPGPKKSAKSPPKSSKKTTQGTRSDSSLVATRTKTSSTKSTVLESASPTTSATSPNEAALKSQGLPQIDNSTSTENVDSTEESTPQPSIRSRKNRSAKKSSKKVAAKQSSSKKSPTKTTTRKKAAAKSDSEPQSSPSGRPSSQDVSSTTGSEQPIQAPETADAKKTAKRNHTKAASAKVPPQINPFVQDIRSALEQYGTLKRSSEHLIAKLQQLHDADQIPALFKLFASEEDPFGLRSSIILTLEAFPEDDYYTGLIEALPQLAKHCPTWGFVMLLRLVNTRGYQDDAWKRFVATLVQHPPRIRKIVQTVLEEHREQTSSDTNNIIRLALTDLSTSSK